MGLLPTYSRIGVLAPLLLLLLRVLQGAAIGGEAPGAWVFVSEHVSPRHRNLACGALSSGLIAGILIGSLVARMLDASLDSAQMQAWGWRVPFLLGGVFGLLAMFLRRQLHETPVFDEIKAARLLSAGMPLKSVVRDHAGAVALAMLLTAAVVVTVLMMPPLLEQRGVGRDARWPTASAPVACSRCGAHCSGSRSGGSTGKRRPATIRHGCTRWPAAAWA